MRQTLRSLVPNSRDMSLWGRFRPPNRRCRQCNEHRRNRLCDAMHLHCDSRSRCRIPQRKHKSSALQTTMHASLRVRCHDAVNLEKNAIELRNLFPLTAFKNAPNPNLSKICPSDCFWVFQSGDQKSVKDCQKLSENYRFSNFDI